MLHDFLTEHRDDLIERTRQKMSERPAPKAGSRENPIFGVPLFLTQLVAVLRAEAAGAIQASVADISASATQHGSELLRMGFTVDSVVHTYGDVCQSVTELAQTLKFIITTDEFRTLNRALDDAIAGAVTEYGRQREEELEASEAARVGLAFEQRGMLSSAMLAWEILKRGTVGTNGNTARVLTSSLEGLRVLNNGANGGSSISDPATFVDK
jgi:hypothetical protein